MNSDSDSDSDIFLDTNSDYKVNNEENGDDYYQLQHKSDDIFTFKYFGSYKNEPVVSLGNFNSEGKSFYLESNFIKKVINGVSRETNVETNLYPMLSVYINDSGRLIKVVTGIELNVDVIDINKEYTGKSYIELVDESKGYREVIKKGLIFPGSTKIVYFLIKELSNEKILDYINGKTD